jgi:hypothetical protein
LTEIVRVFINEVGSFFLNVKVRLFESRSGMVLIAVTFDLFSFEILPFLSCEKQELFACSDRICLFDLLDFIGSKRSSYNKRFSKSLVNCARIFDRRLDSIICPIQVLAFYFKSLDIMNSWFSSSIIQIVSHVP